MEPMATFLMYWCDVLREEALQYDIVIVMVIVIELLVASVGLAQERLEVISHDTTSPSTNVLVVKVGELVPTLVAPILH
jgi:hypothetical protein